MKENCLDMGIIQSFLDGEVSLTESARVSGHTAQCDDCAVMLAEAEDQSAVVFSALEREFNTLVPTQRLWNKINDSIATERANRPFWQKAFAFLTVSLAKPSFAATASLLVVVGIFAAVWMNRAPVPADIAVNGSQSQQTTAAVVPPTLISRPAPVEPEIDTTSAPTYRVERASYRRETPRVNSAPTTINASANFSTVYMPGEESYVKTISSLAKTVEEQKDGGVMRPSERIAYERDMAVVNDAIAKMKKEVKRNPRNESAKQVLYSSYQNKIDLLNSVSQKEELLVSLK